MYGLLYLGGSGPASGNSASGALTSSSFSTRRPATSPRARAASSTGSTSSSSNRLASRRRQSTRRPPGSKTSTDCTASTCAYARATSAHSESANARASTARFAFHSSVPAERNCGKSSGSTSRAAIPCQRKRTSSLRTSRAALRRSARSVRRAKTALTTPFMTPPTITPRSPKTAAVTRQCYATSHSQAMRNSGAGNARRDAFLEHTGSLPSSRVTAWLHFALRQRGAATRAPGGVVYRRCGTPSPRRGRAVVSRFVGIHGAAAPLICSANASRASR